MNKNTKLGQSVHVVKSIINGDYPSDGKEKYILTLLKRHAGNLLDEIEPEWRPQPVDDVYTSRLSANDVIFTIEEFRAMVADRTLIDYDGWGCPVKNGFSNGKQMYPSDAASIPEDATHFVWYNK